MTAPSTVRPDPGDLLEERSFSPARTFGAAKAPVLLFTFALDRRLEDTQVTVNAFHPGIARTNLMRNAPLTMLPGLRAPKPDGVRGSGA